MVSRNRVDCIYHGIRRDSGGRSADTLSSPTVTPLPHQMGHSKIEITKNIYGHLSA